MSAPRHFLYLVDEATEEAVSYCSIDGMAELDVIALERRLRADRHVDTTDSGLVIRDSRNRPEEAAKVRAWIARHAPSG